jgi:hypothetical protein
MIGAWREHCPFRSFTCQRGAAWRPASGLSKTPRPNLRPGWLPPAQALSRTRDENVIESALSRANARISTASCLKQPLRMANTRVGNGDIAQVDGGIRSMLIAFAAEPLRRTIGFQVESPDLHNHTAGAFYPVDVCRSSPAFVFRCAS